MKKIFLFENFTSDKSIFVGTIFIDNIRGKEIYSFEYDNEYLMNPTINVCFDQGISLYKGLQYPYGSKNMFSFLSDLIPDRWGKLLIRHNLKLNNDVNNNLQESDYLLYVNDLTRMGGFRLSTDKKNFVSNDDQLSIPPYIYLNKLEQAAIEFSKNGVVQEWMKELLYSGSSLGGARPKASIFDTNNNLYIAKFPAINDEYDVEAFEAVSYEIAKLLKINVCDFKVEKLSRYGSTLLIKRFDRDNDRRIHYQSCLSLLNKEDGEKGSYLDIVSLIKSNSRNIDKELLELFKRIVFYIAINNCDNHLRNIAFIIEKDQMSLTPCFDINPCLYKNAFATSFRNDGNDKLIDAINNAQYFNLTKKQAEEIVSTTLQIIKANYSSLCQKYKINRSKSEEMFKSFNFN